MRPPTEFGDPQSELKLLCDALLESPAAADRDFLTDLSISTRLSEGRAPGRLLVVRAGAWSDYQFPVLGVNRARIVAFDRDEDVAWSIASWFHGHLLAYRGGPAVRSVRYDGGPEKGTDPDYDSPIAAFTVRVSMRPVAG